MAFVSFQITPIYAHRTPGPSIIYWKKNPQQSSFCFLSYQDGPKTTLLWLLRLRTNEPWLLCLSTQRRIHGESRFLHLACCCDLSPLLPPSVFSSIYHSLPISVLLHPLQGSHEKSFRGRPINFYGFLFWHLKFTVSIKQLNVFLISWETQP